MGKTNCVVSWDAYLEDKVEKKKKRNGRKSLTES